MSHVIRRMFFSSIPGGRERKVETTQVVQWRTIGINLIFFCFYLPLPLTWYFSSECAVPKNLWRTAQCEKKKFLTSPFSAG